jgi:polygalacturonase
MSRAAKDTDEAPAYPYTTISGATGATSTAQFSVPGATPDDSSDDYSAIQAAIDQAGSAGGGVVNLPAGTFIINGHLLMKDGVELRGAGPATVIKAGPNFLNNQGTAGGYPVISTDGADNVTISDLTADQSGDVLDGNIGGRLSQYLIDVRQSNNVIVKGVYTRNPFTYSITVAGSTNFCVRDCNTRSETDGRYNQLDGIHILNSAYGDVVSNTVDQRIGTDGDDGLVAHTIGGSVHDIRYVGNYVRGGRHGAGMQLAYTNSSDEIYNLWIENNEFWGSPSGIHTGTYGTPGSSYNVTVGGSPTTGNLFRDNDGDAINFSGSLWNIVVTYNTAINSGGFNVGSGSGNIVANNTTS